MKILAVSAFACLILIMGCTPATKPELGPDTTSRGYSSTVEPADDGEAGILPEQPRVEPEDPVLPEDLDATGDEAASDVPDATEGPAEEPNAEGYEQVEGPAVDQDLPPAPPYPLCHEGLDEAALEEVFRANCCVEGLPRCQADYRFQLDRTEIPAGGRVGVDLEVKLSSAFVVPELAVQLGVPELTLGESLRPALIHVEHEYRVEGEDGLRFTWPCLGGEERGGLALVLEVNPLVCAGAVLELEFAMEAGLLGTEKATLELTVVEDEHGRENPPLRALAWAEALRHDETLLARLDLGLLARHSSWFGQEAELVDGFSLILALQTGHCACAEDAASRQHQAGLLALWLNLLDGRISPCAELSMSLPEEGLALLEPRPEMTVAEFIVQVETALSQQTPLEGQLAGILELLAGE